jgi:hypothetical protein
MNPVIAGFVKGFAPDEAPPCPRFLTSAESASSSLDMTSTAPQISFAKLATCYPCTRGRLHQVAKQYGRKTLLDPHELAAKMLPDIFAAPAPSPLIDALRDPAERIRIAAQLRQLLS